MKSGLKNILPWAILILGVILVVQRFNPPPKQQEVLKFSDFLARLEKGDVSEVTIQGQEILGVFKGGKEFKTYSPEDPALVRDLITKGISITAKPESQEPLWKSILLSWFPFIFIIAMWLFFMRQMQAGGGKAMSFGKSKAKLLTEHSKKITFKDVAGIDEAKSELVEIIEFLSDPKRFTRLGGRIPKGVLLVGPPGTGKTLLARAIAGEAGVPFFSISGSDFVEMFVGVGAARVRDLFIQGKRNAPCIIFIDEIDAVGRHRGAGLGGGHDEREQTLNQLLVEMDGFEFNEGVILISATNRPDVLDPALLRPGRFDRRVIVPRPDVKGREEILKVHTTRTPLSSDVELAVIARGTPGFAGADIENLVNEAALLAARSSKDSVGMEDFEQAKDKVLMGVERKSMIISEEEKRNTAYHEAGHALVAKLIPGTDPIHKVTIIPRGMALGATQQLPVDERHNYASDYLMNSICILMGGRAAEQIVLSQMTTGAGNDLEHATDLARKMVCEWGMSAKLGPMTFGKREEMIFLGKEITQQKDYSEMTSVEIDKEVKRILVESYERARTLLTENLSILKALATLLLEKEVLDSNEIDVVLNENALKPSPAKPVTAGAGVA